MKKVALNDIHIALKAKMVPFAGFNMPVRYTSDIEEHLCVRNGVGVFDVSHMGEFILEGKQALDLIQKVTSNDASVLSDGKIQYSCLPNDKGGIVDDLLVYRFNEYKYMLVVNASNIDKDLAWVKSYNSFGVDIQDVSGELSLFAIQGPKAVEVLQKITSTNVAELSYYSFTIGKVADIDNVIISATGYTGSGGFELYVPNNFANQLWDALFFAGKEYDIKPIGLGARDTLRLEMGYCLYGNDINDSTSTIEANLGWITRFTKDFVGRNLVEAQKKNGVSRKLTGFELLEKGIPRAHYPIANALGETIGEVTSGTQSPVLNKGIGMGYLDVAYTKPDSEIFIKVREKLLKAKVVSLPFYKK